MSTLAAALLLLQVSTASYVGVSTVAKKTWDSFNTTVSGRLHNGQPMLAPCFNNYNGVHQTPGALCTVVETNKSNNVVITEYFGGYENSNWGTCQSTGQGCGLNFSANPDEITPLTTECYQGSVPSKYVEVQTVADIQKTLAFAQKNHLRLVIKNTGHDYKGRSSAPDSLALWMHNYQPALKLERNFIPAGCASSVGDVITMGAGQQFKGLYQFAYDNGVRVVGGTSASVGAAGGWITGGGHSILSNELGLGVDNAQQIKAVLPNGTYITANRCQNTDLFFALRGGGGGTFGVITELSLLAHADAPMQLAQMQLGTVTPENIKTLISIMVENAEQWADEGWSGYIYPGVVPGVYSTVLMANANLTLVDAESSLVPLTQFATDTLDPTVTGVYIYTVPSVFDIVGTSVTGALDNINNIGVSMASRLIPRKSFQDTSSQTELTSLLYDIFISGQSNNTQLPLLPLQLNLIAPVTYSKSLPASDLPGGPGASAVTPAWRESLWHIIQTRSWDGTTTDPDTVEDYWQATHDALTPLREFTPNSGAYVNEADPFEPDYANTFWGAENYARLLKIKKQIDPQNLLTVHQGVGWDQGDARYACYPDVSA